MSALRVRLLQLERDSLHVLDGKDALDPSEAVVCARIAWRMLTASVAALQRPEPRSDQEVVNE